MKKTRTRLLALVLALVLVIGMTTTGASARLLEQATTLTAGDIKNVNLQSAGQKFSLSFTPEQEGDFCFHVVNMGDNQCDVSVGLYTTAGTMLISRDLWGYGAEDLTYSLTAGTKYLLILENKDAACQLQVSVTYVPAFYYDIVDGGAVIRSYNKDERELVIPATLDGYPVVGIDSLGGETIYRIEKLEIPDSVTSLGRRLFGSWNIPLKELKLGSGISGLTVNTFLHMGDLETITVSEDNPEYTVVDGVLYDKAVTRMVHLPQGRKTTHKVPDSVTDLSVIFGGAALPNRVWIETGAGTPEYITEDGVIYNTDKTVLYVTSPEKSGSYVMPGTVEEIRPYGVSGTKLTDITISPAVTHIAYGTFSHNSALSSIRIPGSVRSIETAAFESCPSLDQVHIQDLVAWCHTVFDDNPLIQAHKLYMDGAQITDLVIPSVVQRVYPWAFKNAEFASVTIPANVKKIDTAAFYSTDVPVVNFSEGLEILGHGAFCGSTVQAVALPDSLTQMGEYAFSECQDLEFVTFGSGLKEIPYEAFSNAGLKQAVIPENVERIGFYAFYDCRDLCHVTFENDSITIGREAFAYCPLWEIELADTVDLSDYAWKTFYGNDAVTLKVPESAVTDYVYNTFGGNETMRSVVIPETAASVLGFSGNTNISHVLYQGTQAQWEAIEVVDQEILDAEHIHFEAVGDEITVERTCTQIRHYCAICDAWDIIDIEGAAHDTVNGVCLRCGYAEDGWVEEDGKWYFYENGQRVVSQWRADSVGWVYLGADGAMLTNAWQTDSVGWCYVGADGYCVTNCWQQDSTGWCYLNDQGRMATNQWIEDSVGWCYVGENGYCVTNCWKQDSVGWVYLGADGRMLINDWVMDSVGWCYVGWNGYAVTNCWKQDSVGWCYLNSVGSMIKNDWVWDNGWYWLDGNGYMVFSTSVTVNGTVYYFDASGLCTNP